MSSAINLNGADRTVVASSGLSGTVTSTLSGAITNSTGTAGLIKEGAGVLILSSTNTYNGNTTVSAGTLTANTTGALPGFATSGRVTVAANAMLSLRTGAWTAANIDSVRGAATWSAESSRLGFDTTTANFSYASNITEALSVNKLGTNTLTLTGNNSYTGGTVLTAGTLSIGSATAIPGTGTISFNGATIQSSDATLRTLANPIAVNSNITVGGTGNLTFSNTGATALGAARTITVTTSGTIAEFAQAFSGGFAINKAGAGTLVLSGTNTNTVTGTNPTYTNAGGGVLVFSKPAALTGIMQVNGTNTGTYRLQSDSDVTTSTSGIQSFSTATLNLQVDRQTAGSGSGLDYNFTHASNGSNDISGGATVNISAGANITSGTPTVTINQMRSQGGTSTAAATINASGVNVNIGSLSATAAGADIWTLGGTSNGSTITGAISHRVIKQGTGTWTLSGTNTYAGNTEANQGVLNTTRAASLAGYTTAGRVVLNGGTLGVRIGGAGWTTTEVNTLLTNATKTSGALGIDTTNGNLTQWTAFTTTNLGSALGLNKLGTNTLTLDLENTYNGATTVSEGTLLVNGSTVASSTVGVSSGATLGGTGTIAGAVNVSGVLSPGASIETLGSGTLSFANGSSLLHELDSSVATSVGSDLLKVTGNLNLAGTVGLTLSDFAVSDVAFNVDDVFSMINYTGTWNGGLFTFEGNELAEAEEFTFGLNNWRINYSAPTGGLNFAGEHVAGSFVNLTVIPEPSSVALLGTLGAMMLLRRRR